MHNRLHHDVAGMTWNGTCWVGPGSPASCLSQNWYATHPRNLFACTCSRPKSFPGATLYYRAVLSHCASAAQGIKWLFMQPRMDSLRNKWYFRHICALGGCCNIIGLMAVNMVGHGYLHEINIFADWHPKLVLMRADMLGNAALHAP